MIGVMLKCHFASAGGGPGDFRSDETLERRFGEFGHSKNLWAFQEPYRPGPGPMGPTVPARDPWVPIGPYGPIGPYIGPYKGPYRALYRALFGCPILHCGLPRHKSGMEARADMSAVLPMSRCRNMAPPRRKFDHTCLGLRAAHSAE